MIDLVVSVRHKVGVVLDEEPIEDFLIRFSPFDIGVDVPKVLLPQKSDEGFGVVHAREIVIWILLVRAALPPLKLGLFFYLP